jgi:hypothetical protein
VNLASQKWYDTESGTPRKASGGSLQDHRVEWPHGRVSRSFVCSVRRVRRAPAAIQRPQVLVITLPIQRKGPSGNIGNSIAAIALTGYSLGCKDGRTS